MALRVGVDIGGTKMAIVARDGAGRLVAEQETPTGPAAAAPDLERAVRTFCAGLDPAPERIAVAVPGLVAGHERVVSSDVLPGLAGWTPFADGAPGPAYVINDVRAALATATGITGAGDVLCVVAGTAIGAAFTGPDRGRTFHGADGWAGELGYLPVRDDGGAWRRLDEVAGGAAILHSLGMSAEQVTGRLNDGDPVVVARVVSSGEALGRGIACCVNLLNPRKLFVGGGACRFPGYVEAALRTARAHTLPESWAALEVSQFPDPRRFVADGALIASAR